MYRKGLDGRREPTSRIRNLLIIISVALIALVIHVYTPAAQAGEDAWVQVNSNGFGIGSGQSLGMIGNDGYLYDVAASGFGLQVMEYDGSRWIAVNEPGFGNIFNQRGGARSTLSARLPIR